MWLGFNIPTRFGFSFLLFFPLPLEEENKEMEIFFPYGFRISRNVQSLYKMLLVWDAIIYKTWHFPTLMKTWQSGEFWNAKWKDLYSVTVECNAGLQLVHLFMLKYLFLTPFFPLQQWVLEDSCSGQNPRATSVPCTVSVCDSSVQTAFGNLHSNENYCDKTLWPSSLIGESKSRPAFH